MFMYEERAGPVSGRKDLKEHFPAICMQVVSDLPYLVWDSPQFAGFSTRAQFWCVEICRTMQYCAGSSITNYAVWGCGNTGILKKYCVFRYYAEFGVRRYALGDARVHLCPPLPTSQMSWWENWPAPIFPAMHQAFPGLKAAVLEISLVLVML